jgi:uncharacterized protein
MPGPVIDIEMDNPRLPGGKRRVGCGGLVAALLVLLFGAKTIAWWILDYEWWEEVHQTAAWWQQLYVHTAPMFYATAAGFLLLWLIHARALRSAGARITRFPFYMRLSSLVLLAVSFVLSAIQFSSWDVARWIGSRGLPPSEFKDPVFGQPLSFYFFDLPFYQSLAGFLFLLFTAGTLIFWLVGRVWTLRDRFQGGTVVLDWSDLSGSDTPGLRILGTLALTALAVREWFDRYSAVYDRHPFMTGADYIAVNLTIPLTTAWAVGLFIGALLILARKPVAALLVLLIIPIRAVVPGLVNSFYVKPNEITLQRPYIESHIQATRSAYGLNARYKEVDWKLAPEARLDAAKHQALLSNVRLWDWQAFHDTVSQIQPLRPYIFFDSDVDRYRLNNRLQQVMLSPRELEMQQLGEARNRWPNRHVIYTHGYGVVAADANSITPDGLPRLFIQDAPPKVSAPGMKLSRPEIYYGEVAEEYVFVNTSQPEFNYPSGSENVHNHYSGPGGFPIGSLGIRLAAAVAEGDWNILLTSYLKADSRMMIRRQVKERVDTLAPFLAWDEDPYLVINSQGHLVWMIDGYSTSASHPYSEYVRTREEGTVNYVRNAVKGTVDAYTGETKLYVFAPEDPLIQSYQRLFPGLLLDKASMPADLREHARYPEWMFRVQAEILLTFHMQDPEAFYNKVDVWDVAHRSAGADRAKVPLDPSYLVAVVPEEAGGKGQAEFLLMLPFTPRSKDNLIGFLIARCDGEALGEMVLMELPKEQLIYGPMQIESRINQDQNISKDLTLWNQQGSQVLRGQMVVVPVDGTFLFVQPIYLQSSQARMPQLKKVAIAFGNDLIYTDTYDQAVAQLTGRRMESSAPGQEKEAPAPSPGSAAPGQTSGGGQHSRQLETIRQLMDRYRKAASLGQWSEAGKALEGIETELRKGTP